MLGSVISVGVIAMLSNLVINFKSLILFSQIVKLERMQFFSFVNLQTQLIAIFSAKFVKI